MADTVTIPTTEHARLLAIEAAYERLKDAARNALENSWHIDTPHPDCVCHDWRGCTVLDDKDAKELREALKTEIPHPGLERAENVSEDALAHQDEA